MEWHEIWTMYRETMQRYLTNLSMQSWNYNSKHKNDKYKKEWYINIIAHFLMKQKKGHYKQICMPINKYLHVRDSNESTTPDGIERCNNDIHAIHNVTDWNIVNIRGILVSTYWGNL
jgi:hypothetical protein